MLNNYIKGLIDRIEGQKAITSLDDGQKLNWQIENLPPNCMEGTPIKLILSNDDISGEDEKEILAKNILNEILSTE